MTDINSDRGPTIRRRARRFKMIGVGVLAVGIVSASLVYWLGTRSGGLPDDASMSRFNRPEQQQMAILYGKQGALIEDLSNSLQQPGTQAGIIIVFAAFVSMACLYFARVTER